MSGQRMNWRRQMWRNSGGVSAYWESSGQTNKGDMTHPKLSKLQKQILAELAGRDCVTVRALREHFPTTLRPSLSRAISRLQDRGLVERVSLQIGKRTAPAVRLAGEKLTVSEIFEGSGIENKGVNQPNH